MFVTAYNKDIPDYGDPTTNKAESMFANIKRLIRQYFGETRPGMWNKCGVIKTMAFPILFLIFISFLGEFKYYLSTYRGGGGIDIKCCRHKMLSLPMQLRLGGFSVAKYMYNIFNLHSLHPKNTKQCLYNTWTLLWWRYDK